MALLTLVGWFAMGAFVGTTVEHHLNLLQDGSSPLAWFGGGATAAVVALLFKSV
jgi:hypothetical protein